MTESPSTTHNLNLLTALCAKLGVHSRYPRVSEQAECLLLDVSGLPPFAYNPSIIQTQGGLWMTYRYHFAGDFRTRLGICRISDGKAVRIQDLPIDGFSVEDARLFMFQMEPWLTWVEAKWEANFVNPKSVVKFAKLELPHNDTRRCAYGRQPGLTSLNLAETTGQAFRKIGVFLKDTGKFCFAFLELRRNK